MKSCWTFVEVRTRLAQTTLRVQRYFTGQHHRRVRTEHTSYAIATFERGICPIHLRMQLRKRNSRAYRHICVTSINYPNRLTTVRIRAPGTCGAAQDNATRREAGPRRESQVVRFGSSSLRREGSAVPWCKPSSHWTFTLQGEKCVRDHEGKCMRCKRGYALERARIFLRLRRSLRDLFFFHFSLILCKAHGCGQLNALGDERCKTYVYR